MSLIALQSVVAGYGRTTVLHGVDLELDPGFHVLLGANGAGKTTLFRVGVGILPPREGRVQILGCDPYQQVEIKRVVGYLPHRPSLYAGLSVRENLEFWARALRLNAAERRQQLERVITEVGLGDLLVKSAGSLSRGQAQRVAVARVLLGNPQILFLDEPTTGLDPLVARDMRALLKGLARSEKTVIYSTHNLYEAAELADDLILLAAGRVVDRGPIEVLRQRYAETPPLCLSVEGDPQPVLTRLGYAPIYDGHHWIVEPKSQEEKGQIVEALVKANLRVLEVRESGNPLEAIYEVLESERRSA